MKVDWIILADYADIANNKLYLMGGGWDTLTVNSGFPLRYPCGIAVAFSVPWDETNETHDITVEISDDDEVLKLANINGQVVVGRPAGIPPGQTQRVQFAVNMPLEFPKSGGYVVRASVAGQERGRSTFTVAEGPNVALRSSRGEGG